MDMRRSDQMLSIGVNPYSRVFLDAMSGQCAILDDRGRIICVNKDWQSFAEANEYADDQEEYGFGLGLNYLSVCDSASGDCGQDARKVGKGIRQVLEKELVEFSLEYPCHSPTVERWFKIHVRLLSGFEIGAHHVLVQHVDVTDQVTTRMELEVSRRDLQRRMTTLIESAPIRIAILDPDFRYRFANKVFCDGVGIASEDLVGMSVESVLDAGTLARLKPMMSRAMLGEPQSCEMTVKLKNGRELEAIVTYLPDDSERDRVSGIYAIIHDVSELKLREAETVQAKQRANRASAAKSEFLGCMSHELRTPLNAII